MFEQVRAWLRAAFIVFHCTALFLMAFPAPGGGMRRSTWEEPTVQGEFKAWTERVNGWGWDITQDELEDELWDVAVVYMEGRGKVLKPLRPYYKYTGTTQSWRMFVAPHRYPAKLEIHVKQDGDWVLVYRQNDDDADWMAQQLDFDRWRSAMFRFSWSPYKKQYKTFRSWVAQHAVDDFPDATHVRTRFYKYKTPSPEQVKNDQIPEGKYILSYEVDLADYRETP